MNPQEWYHNYYNPENRKLLDIIRDLEFGKIEIEIHEKLPVMVLQPVKKIKLQRKRDAKNNRTI